MSRMATSTATEANSSNTTKIIIIIIAAIRRVLCQNDNKKRVLAWLERENYEDWTIYKEHLVGFDRSVEFS